jgi:S-adenosylmethionine:tRNA ribosyltransferase-isomerase
LAERAVEQIEITLHVGLGTFQPIRTQEVEAHHLHSERYFISPEAAAAIQKARAASRRVIAIGTTTARTLEYIAQQNSGEVLAGGGEANLFIYPGFKFQVIQGLLTNFHLPQSTLLMLVCAFAGMQTVMRGYQHAVASRYRFYSYGDCMFVD